LLVSLRGSSLALGQGEAAHVLVEVKEEKKPAKSEAMPKRGVLVALAGQPNVGKSSVFNLLTGMNQHVGNWTGKTVDCKTGSFIFEKQVSLL